MHLPAPAVEASPQPVNYNDPGIEKLRALSWTAHSNRQTLESAMLNRCEDCGDFFTSSEGYVFLDDFLCDHCHTRFARKAGLFSGR